MGSPTTQPIRKWKRTTRVVGLGHLSTLLKSSPSFGQKGNRRKGYEEEASEAKRKIDLDDDSKVAISISKVSLVVATLQ